MSVEFTLGRRMVGYQHPTYFVADIAANHDGQLERAKRLIRLAGECGAQAAKFQNFRAPTIVSDRGFRDLGTQMSHQAKWGKSVYAVYQDASLPLEWTEELKACCDEAGIDYFTAPYDLELLPALAPNVCAWKLGSGDITWHAMIRRLAEGGKPLLIATGAATLQEVRDAVAAASACRDIVLMQCNTNYTGSIENLRHVNLRVLATYAKEFPGVVVGLSDHTPGHATVLGAIALGARVVEKHFTDDKSRQGPDHGFSMSPIEWQEMVMRTRELEAALGDGTKRVMDNESETVVLQRRAIRAGKALRAGETITEASIVVLRPCPPDAIPPHRLAEVLGRVLKRDLDAGEHIRTADLR